ncbi:MAG: serine--tRNA ligase [Elusimicrobiota bacterium]
MIDIKYIREKFSELEKALEKRGVKIPLDEVREWDTQRRKIVTEIDALRSERKKLSDEVADCKKKNKPCDKIIAQSESLREKIKEKEKFFLTLEQNIEDFLLRIPNILDETVPEGKCDADNVVIRTFGSPEDIQKKFKFEPRPHWEVGTTLDILDFETASKISGSRFYILKKAGAALERALIYFMIDVHTKERGYTEIFAPYLVNKKAITGTGQLPKFEIEVFKCRDDDLYLIPTAEVSITNLHQDEIIPEEELPQKYVSYSACFRREAGSYGKDTRGVIRVHQFNKVELVMFVKPEESAAQLEALTKDAEEILKKLNLPYRVRELCSGDMGFAASKTYDLDVWMPGEKTWREVSSCSNFKDFQARRLNIKVKRKDGSKDFIHTINGSGLAVGRTFAAVIENYQSADGTVEVPAVLRPYLGADVITR